MNRLGRRRTDHRNFMRVSAMQAMALLLVMLIVLVGKKINFEHNDAIGCRVESFNLNRNAHEPHRQAAPYQLNRA